MKNKIIYFSLFVILLNANKVSSQNLSISGSSKVYQFKGQILDSEKHPVVYARISNIHRKSNALTDTSGFFRIIVVHKDTLRITAIGYQTKYIGIDEKQMDDSSVHVIQLEKRVYDLPTVNIYELRWQIFKSEFMEQKAPKDETKERISNWMAKLVPSDELRMIFQGSRMPSGFGPNASFALKSKSERSKKKLAKIEKKYSLIAPKFNDKIITNLTGLQGKEIYKFLEFCDFSEDYLIQSSEYEIFEKILEKWELYKKKKP